MDMKDKLLSRLDEIGNSLRASENALCLLALGSCGRERERLDGYSDLDFFVIVKEGFKNSYIENISWLENITKIVFYHRNTVDGYKVLFEDGVFCEFAVFEPEELKSIPFAPGQIVWKAPGFREDICNPPLWVNSRPVEGMQWMIDEALTNLYVGICRFKRGEILSAFKFIESHALDRVLKLTRYVEVPSCELHDMFSAERRYERIFPKTSENLPYFLRGYKGIMESARSILEFLDRNFVINQEFKSHILNLMEEEHI